MAVAVRGGQVPGVILHTDQGSEYTAGTVRAAYGRLSIRQSMGRPGSGQGGHSNPGTPRWSSSCTPWIDDYNRHRHSALAMLSPVNYEKALQAGKAA
jgi:putative transposase